MMIDRIWRWLLGFVFCVPYALHAPHVAAKGSFPIAIAQGAQPDPKNVQSSKTFSVGQPQVGALLNAVPLDSGTAFTVRAKRNFGTPELIDVLEAAGSDVQARFPKTPRLYIGDLSYAHGGPIGSHVSHQSGRDADVSYYLTKGHDSQRLKHASQKNLDTARTWAFMESLLRSGHVQMIFTDRRLKTVLRQHARDIVKVDETLLTRWFDGDSSTPEGRPILRHLKGHQNHFHLRVYAPQSQISLDALGGGRLASKARETLAAAHAFREQKHLPVDDTQDMGVTQSTIHSQDTHKTSTAAPLVEHPELNPGFSTDQLAQLLAEAQTQKHSPSSRARARARKARFRARRARRRAAHSRVRWYQKHPERLAAH